MVYVMHSTRKIANPVMSVFTIENLRVTFDTTDGVVEAVKDISLNVAEGECLGIVGESGSGKSQTFLAALGLLAVNGSASGSVRLCGQEILNASRIDLNQLRGNDVGMIFQDPLTALTPHLRIGQQMAEVLKAHRGMSNRQSRQLCLAWLDRVRIPDAAARLKQYPHELSGGMRQRVMIAMAMLCEPKLLIADEPTTALDVTVQADILDLMSEMQHQHGTAIALVTHDMGVVARLCDRVQVMRSGECVERGSVEQIFAASQNAYTRSLLEAMPRLDSELNRSSFKAGAAKQVLDVQDIKIDFAVKSSGGLFARRTLLRAVDGVSFDLHEGETLGIVGESGCGKSTLARAVLQLLKTTSGNVAWLGTNLQQLDKQALKAARRDMQIVFQDPFASLDPRMTIADSIAEPLRTYRSELSRREIRQCVGDMMQRVGLEPQLINRYPHELSGGQNQRVGIARAMINRPRMIVCDEAVSALDVSVQAQIMDLLKDLQAEYGLSMLFISHDLSVVGEMSDRIMVIYMGRVVELGRSEVICQHPGHPYTQALISAVPIPDPRVERNRERIRLAGELPSAIDPDSAFRFLPSRLSAKVIGDPPQLQQVGEGHFVAEHDPVDSLLA